MRFGARVDERRAVAAPLYSRARDMRASFPRSAEAGATYAKLQHSQGGIVAQEWIQIWEEFMVRAVESCRRNNSPIVVVSHKLFATEPYEAAKRLNQDLAAHGADLEMLSKDDVHGILGNAWVSGHQWRFSHASFDEPARREMFMSNRARAMWDILAEAFTSSTSDVPRRLKALHDTVDMDALSWDDVSTRRDRKSDSARQAYVTMLSSDNLGYAHGTRVLAASLRTFDSRRKLIAMVSQEVESHEVMRILRRGGWNIVKVPKLKRTVVSGASKVQQVYCLAGN